MPYLSSDCGELKLIVFTLLRGHRLVFRNAKTSKITFRAQRQTVKVIVAGAFVELDPTSMPPRV
jgi:hypothetical protein